METRLSSDGQVVAYVTRPDDLTGAPSQVYVQEVGAAPVPELASVSPSGAPLDEDSSSPVLNGAGSEVAFTVETPVLGFEPAAHSYVRDRQRSATRSLTAPLVERPVCVGASRRPALNEDGAVAAFASTADDLVPGDTNRAPDVFIHDRRTAVTVRVSVGSGGEQAEGDSALPSVSQDGLTVAFWSQASNLGAAADRRPVIIVHDRLARKALAVPSSSYPAGSRPSHPPALSGDGRYIAFVSDSNLAVYDRERESTTQVGAAAVPVELPVLLSTDGNTVVYGDSAYDRPTGRRHELAVDALALSADGGAAVGLSPGADKGLYAVDVESGAAQALGPGFSHANRGDDASPTVSGDGRFVAFHSTLRVVDPATPLLADSAKRRPEAFVWDRLGGTITAVSTTLAGAAAHGQFSAIRADGRYIAFESGHGNIVPADLNHAVDVFVHDRTPVRGYWLAAADGGVFSFGDATFHGSTGNLTLGQPIVGIAATRTGGGYWMTVADGGVFTFGDGAYAGSTGNRAINHPIIGVAAR